LALLASQASSTSTISPISQRRLVTLAAIAGVVRSVLWMRTKLSYTRTAPPNVCGRLNYASGSAIGRSLLAPPGIPAEHAQALRTAFQAMVKDPDFVAEIQRLKVDLDPLPGEHLERLVAQTLSIPAAVRERAKAAFGR
jgi:hypothetical protein